MNILNILLASHSNTGSSYFNHLALIALVTLGLTACEKPKGTLKITTNPGDAEIYINGERKGNSPAKKGQAFAAQIAEGEYKIEAKIKIPGDEYTQKCGNKDVLLSANTLQTVDIKLYNGCLTKKGEQRKSDIEKLEAPSKTVSLASDAYRNLSSRAQDFVINSNGTVYDKRTKLEWMRCSLGQTLKGNACEGETKKYGWQEALDAAKGYRFAGHTDWRLPNRWELETLVYCSSGKQDPRDKKYKELRQCRGNSKIPTIAQSVFPNASNFSYWSSSPYVYRNNHAWGVYFNGGYGYKAYKYYEFSVRLVRTR